MFKRDIFHYKQKTLVFSNGTLVFFSVFDNGYYHGFHWVYLKHWWANIRWAPRMSVLDFHKSAGFLAISKKGFFQRIWSYLSCTFWTICWWFLVFFIFAGMERAPVTSTVFEFERGDKKSRGCQDMASQLATYCHCRFKIGQLGQSIDHYGGY